MLVEATHPVERSSVKCRRPSARPQRISHRKLENRDVLPVEVVDRKQRPIECDPRGVDRGRSRGVEEDARCHDDAVPGLEPLTEALHEAGLADDIVVHDYYDRGLGRGHT